MGQQFTFWEQFALEIAKGLPTAMIALVVGVIAARIAHRQYKVAAGKFNLDLFQERYKVYEVIDGYLSAFDEDVITRNTSETTLKFKRSINKAHFLFGPSIGNMMTSTYYYLSDLNNLELRLQSAHDDDDPDVQRDKRDLQEINQFLAEQKTALRRSFSVFMDFQEWRGTARKSSVAWYMKLPIGLTAKRKLYGYFSDRKSKRPKPIKR